jgi:putative ABC transport system permease protein
MDFIWVSIGRCAQGQPYTRKFWKVSFRKSLMVIQFVVSMVFIFWIGHMYNQFNYMATENENYNRKGIFNISMVDKNYSLLKR